MKWYLKHRFGLTIYNYFFVCAFCFLLCFSLIYVCVMRIHRLAAHRQNMWDNLFTFGNNAYTMTVTVKKRKNFCKFFCLYFVHCTLINFRIILIILFVFGKKKSWNSSFSKNYNRKGEWKKCYFDILYKSVFCHT